MNFLAHSALAFGDPALLAGQFAGDFVRGPDLSRFPERVAHGIRLHRRVDAFSDAHPAVVAARRGFEPDLRRHAGIVADVVFDHLLARHWPAPGGRDLSAHARWTDAALAAHEHVLPPAVARFRAFAAREGVLAGNVDTARIATTFVRLSRRSPTMAPLALAADRVEPLVERLREPFLALWPALEAMAVERLGELEAGTADGGATRGDDVAAASGGAPARAPRRTAGVTDEGRGKR